MKKILFLVFLLITLVIATDLINTFSASDSMTLEGYLLIKEETNYLVSDDKFDSEVANKITGSEILSTYNQVYILDKIPFSLKKIKNGQKVKVYHNGIILESNPAKVNVLKMKNID
ncbi:DUF3221 domain-containing protein [Ornithinibacillus salinisoli]|uniref:DUF3221 domain-containing protein n=1 Tax=Ornithinibacillus salinisoli TaxID=1848459 RepID=A0ABW4W442_9BACI